MSQWLPASGMRCLLYELSFHSSFLLVLAARFPLWVAGFHHKLTTRRQDGAATKTFSVIRAKQNRRRKSFWSFDSNFVCTFRPVTREMSKSLLVASVKNFTLHFVFSFLSHISHSSLIISSLSPSENSKFSNLIYICMVRWWQHSTRFQIWNLVFNSTLNIDELAASDASKWLSVCMRWKMIKNFVIRNSFTFPQPTPPQTNDPTFIKLVNEKYGWAGDMQNLKSPLSLSLEMNLLS